MREITLEQDPMRMHWRVHADDDLLAKNDDRAKCIADASAQLAADELAELQRIAAENEKNAFVEKFLKPTSLIVP